MPEETKPMEREAFERFVDDTRMIKDDCDRASFTAGWDAALERAAQRCQELANEADNSLDHGLAEAVLLQAAHQIRALKGSR